MAQTIQKVVQEMKVSADAVLNRTIDLRPYPYRHLSVCAEAGWGHRGVTAVLAAAELLATAGWELTSVFTVGESSLVYGVLRRRDH